ncbi:alpha/beta fold hydrolase [Fretibacter rubidus]|uniref:alpha/beta fold hydrolase n=1 Tax=Fretibacter rubidus TaxID=570162 RepID=UPI00352BCE5F
MRKGYFGDDGAQIHYRQWPGLRDIGDWPIIMLPPAPHTGLFFETAAAHMHECHTVYSIDYPGYGGSDTLIHPPTIEAYAEAFLPFITSLKGVRLVGFHTGNLVAIELAARHPTFIQNMILVDVPYFDTETRDKYAASLRPDGVPQDIKSAFDKSVKGDSETERARSYALWVESQRSFANRNDAFKAAFKYDAKCRIKDVKCSTVICGTDSALYDLSKAAAGDIQGSEFEDWRNYKSPAFEMDNGRIGIDIIDNIS